MSEAERGKIENRVNVTALWSHHQPLSSAAARRLSTLAKDNRLQLRILCSSASCITMAASLGIPAERFVLPTLCKESPLQPFVLHHVFYKAVLEKGFPSVLQMVAGLCLAYSEQIVLINPNVNFDFLSILNSEVFEVLSKARSEVSPNTSSLRFTRRRELVFAQTSEPRSPIVKDLMEKVMASLDPLPTPVKDNLPIMGKSKLWRLPELAERVIDVFDVVEDQLVKEGEEPGCIHYDSFQTDCRKGKEEKYCAINAGNEMQVFESFHKVSFNILHSEPGKHAVSAPGILLGRPHPLQDAQFDASLHLNPRLWQRLVGPNLWQLHSPSIVLSSTSPGGSAHQPVEPGQAKGSVRFSQEGRTDRGSGYTDAE